LSGTITTASAAIDTAQRQNSIWPDWAAARNSATVIHTACAPSNSELRWSGADSRISRPRRKAMTAVLSGVASPVT
jgi:hypothetical protein